MVALDGFPAAAAAVEAEVGEGGLTHCTRRRTETRRETRG